MPGAPEFSPPRDGSMNVLAYNVGTPTIADKIRANTNLVGRVESVEGNEKHEIKVTKSPQSELLDDAWADQVQMLIAGIYMNHPQ